MNRQEWDLRQAFPPMPADCHDALMRAARSVKEEEPMKKMTFSLIVALSILAAMTAALAAGEWMGWSDFFSEFGSRIEIPKTAQEILTATEAKTYRVGPLTFTVNQLMTDGRIAVCSATAETTDGSPAIISSEIYDAVAANGQNGRAVAQRLGLDPDTSWIDAAHQLKLPFYRVSVWMEVAEQYHDGDDMGDTLWDDQNRCVSYCLASLNEKAVGEQLPVTLKFIVSQYDAEQIEPPMADYATETYKEVKEMNRWRETYEIALPVPAALDQKIYAPAQPVHFSNGLTLNGVKAELTVAGAYVTGQFILDEGVDFHDAYDGELCFLDESGREIPWGMAESGIIAYDQLPLVEWGAMLNLEALPDSLTVAIGTGDQTEKVPVYAAK